MTNTNGLDRCCRERIRIRAEQQQIIDGLSKRFYGSPVLAAHGERDLPPDFGLWNSVYNRFARRSQAEIGHSVFAELASDADFEEVFVDSTIVRVHISMRPELLKKR